MSILWLFPLSWYLFRTSYEESGCQRVCVYVLMNKDKSITLDQTQIYYILYIYASEGSALHGFFLELHPCRYSLESRHFLLVRL